VSQPSIEQSRGGFGGRAARSAAALSRSCFFFSAYAHASLQNFRFSVTCSGIAAVQLNAAQIRCGWALIFAAR
jgi:hypothetical protein